MMIRNRKLEKSLELTPVSSVNFVVEQKPSVIKTKLAFVKGADIKLNFMMKKILLLFALLLVTITTMAQFKISASGNVGIGDIPHPTYRLQVGGQSRFVGNVGISDEPHPTYRLQVGGQSRFASGWIGLILGWSSDNYCPAIYTEQNNAMWLGRPDRWINHLWTYTIDYSSMTKSSDLRLKENLEPCLSVLSKIEQIQTYTFNYNDTYFRDFTPEQKRKAQRKEFGFIAQELEKILPELVYAPDSLREYYGVDYVGMIPILTEAIKEQQVQIESLQKMLSECCSLKNSPIQKNNTSIDNEEIIENETLKGKLYNNIPNPFSVNTEIKFEIPENANSAQLMICNLNGTELKSYNLNQKGLGSIIIQGSEFAAGIYLYTLLVNNQIVDTRKMILTK